MSNEEPPKTVPKTLLRKVFERNTAKRFRAQRQAAILGRMPPSRGMLSWNVFSTNTQVLKAEYLAEKYWGIPERKAKRAKRSSGLNQSIAAGELAAAGPAFERASMGSGAYSTRAVALPGPPPPAYAPYDMNCTSPPTNDNASALGPSRTRGFPSSSRRTSAQHEVPSAIQVPRSEPRVPLGDITELINNTQQLAVAETAKGPKTPSSKLPPFKRLHRAPRR